MSKKTKNEYYINPEEFLNDLKPLIPQFEKKKRNMIERKKNPEIPEFNVEWSDAVTEKFMLIVEGLANNYRFVNYSYKDDMKADAYATLIAYGHNFNPDKGFSPFSYYNRTAWQAFVARINKESKQSEIKMLWTIDQYSLNGDGILDEGDDQVDSLEKMIGMFDEKLKAKENK